MVNNPLYPGYAPKREGKDVPNPLYPGYYTGKPLPRVPQSKNLIKPIEYNIDEFISEVDNAANALKIDPLAGPKWVRKRIADDWSNSLKASIRPRGVEITSLDDYDTVEYPGAVTSLSLNPKDWGVSTSGIDTKQAKKQLKKTLTGWVKESTGLDTNNLLNSNFSDIENKANQQLWARALGFDDTKNLSWTQRKGGEAIAQRTAAIYREDTPINLKKTQSWVKGSDGKMYQQETKDDLYHSAAIAAVEFVGVRDAAKYREGAHEKFLRETLKAADKEIKTAQSYDSLTGNVLKKHEGVTSVFSAGVGNMEDAYSLNGIVGKARESDKKDKGKGLSPSSLSTFASAIAEKKSAFDDRQKMVEGLFSAGKISEKKYNEFTRSSQKYGDALNNLNRAFSSGNFNTAKAALKDKALSKLTGDEIFTGSAAGSIQKFLELDIIRKDKESIGGVVRDEEVRNSGVDLRIKNLAPLMYRLRQDRIQYRTKELLEAWDKEEILERYVWKKITDSLPKGVKKIVTGEFIGDNLKKVNHFGLIFDEKTEAKNALQKKVWDRLYGHKVVIDVDKSLFGFGKIKIQGGKHFDVLENGFLKELIVSDKATDKALFNQLFRVGDGIKPGTSAHDLLTNRLAMRFFGKDFKNLTDGQKEGLESLLKGFGLYNQKIAEKLGSLSEEQKLSLFASIWNKNNSLNEDYKLNRAYIGRLQRIHNTMLSIKKRWEASRLGRSVKFLSNWKNIVSEKAAAYIAGIIAKIIGAAAAATGILAVLTPVIQFAIKKMLTYGQALIKGILKWDLSDLHKILRKDFEKLFKACLACTVLPFIGCSMPVLFFFLSFTSSVSEIDQTRDKTAVLNLCQQTECTAQNPNLVSRNIFLSKSSPGQIAWETAKLLEPGYWCYYNKPPESFEPKEYFMDGDVPIWNQELFDSLGKDVCEAQLRAATSDAWHALFWCTWLTKKAYVLAGIPGADNVMDGNVEVTRQNFIANSTGLGDGQVGSGWDYVANGEVGPYKLKPGDAVFYSTTGGGEGTHIAVVYEIGLSYVRTVESNAPYKSNTLTYASGHFGGAMGLVVLGFGTYR